MSGALLSDGLVRTLADATAKATILLLLPWLASWALRRSSAAVRHRVWSLVLCGLIVLPGVSWLVPGWQLPVLPALPRTADSTPAGGELARRQPTPVRAVLPVAVSAEWVSRPVLVEERPRNRVSTDDRAPGWTTSGALLTIWGAGFLATVLPALLGLCANEWRRRHARRVTSEDWVALLETLRGTFSIRRPVELRQSRASVVPLTWGVIRPVVLLPEDARDWPIAMRRLVLLHELAHIQRFDAAFQVAGRLAAALYWFHPLAWYALRRLRLECEQACDDSVVNSGEQPVEYARQLLDLARSVRIPRLSMTVSMACMSTLEQRMRAMLDGTRDHTPLDRRSGRRLSVLAAVLVLGLATVQARPRSAAADAPPAQTNPAAEATGKATGRISGRVVRDLDGTVARGATVMLVLPPPDGQDEHQGEPPLRPATSDGSGAFSFDGLAPGRYRIFATLGKLTTLRGFERSRVVVLPQSGEAPKPFELRLLAGVAVTVRVKEKATGKPIPGATVANPWRVYPAAATTDGDGLAVVQPFTPARWALEVWADGFARDSRLMDLENGLDAETEFSLGPGGKLEGIVRDPSGKPLADVGLSARAVGGFYQIAYVETDKDGHYRLKSLPRDDLLQIYISKKDYGEKEVRARVTAAHEPLDLVLEARPHGGSIAGLVVDPKDRPVAGAEVVNIGPSSDDVRKMQTGPDGRFSLENLYADRDNGKEVLVRATGFAPKRVKVETGPPDKPAEVRIALEAGHRIKGRVIDEKGRPLDQVSVSFAHRGNPFSDDGGQGTTDAQGRFAFDSLPPNCPFGFSRSAYSEIGNRLLPLDTDAVVTVTMAPAGVIAGRVVYAKTDKPVRSFNVRISFSPRRQPDEPAVGLRGELVEGLTYQSNDGRFQLGDLVLGMPLQVTVSAEGYERQVEERVVAARPDNAGATEFRLVSLDPADLRTYGGRLLDAQGKPVPGAQLRLIAGKPRDPGRRTSFPFNWEMIQSGQLAQDARVTRFLDATTDQQGRFRFSRIPRDSEVELAWWGPGIAPGRADHLERTAENATESIDVRTPPPARIVVTVDLKAYPVAVRIQVSRDDADSGIQEIPLTPDQSDFAMGDLAPGAYWVALTGPLERIDGISGAMTNRSLVSEKVTVGPGETRRVEFTK